MHDPDAAPEMARSRPVSEIELIKAAFEAVPDAFILYDLAGGPLVWNRAYASLVECSDDEIRERMAWDFHPASEVEFVQQTFLRVLETGVPEYIEVGVLTRTGEVIPCGLSGSVLKNGSGEIVGLAGVGRDLSTLKRAETLYDVIMHSSMEGFIISTMDGVFLETNDSYRELLGYGPGDDGPRTIADVDTEHSRRVIRENIKRVVNGGSGRFETQHRRRDGGIMDIEATVTYSDIDGGRLYAFIRDVTDEKRIQAELRDHRDNLQGMVQQRTSELEDLNAKLRREIAERERAEEELRRVNEELEDYAKIVAHEIRTPLSGIFLALEYLEKLAGAMAPQGLDPEMVSIVESAKQTVSSTERQVDRLLKLAKAGQVPEDIDVVEVGAVVGGVMEILGDELERRNAEVLLRGELGTVLADPLHVQLVFTNLISNSLKYCDHEEPLIEVRMLDGSPAGQMRYLVRDNGPGFPDSLIGDLAHGAGFPGDALGMAIVAKIVKVYGGTVTAYNDEGACVEFVLHDYPR